MFACMTSRSDVLARPCKRVAAAVALAVCPAVPGFAKSIALPANVVSALRKSAPVLVSPMPAAKVEKISPVMSETRLSPDKSLAVMLVDEPFCLTAVSKDGKAVELSVPVKPGEKECVERWFVAEDVFGSIENYKYPKPWLVSLDTWEDMRAWINGNLLTVSLKNGGVWTTVDTALRAAGH